MPDPERRVVPVDSLESQAILAMAKIVELSAVIEIASGDREPSMRVADEGRRWIVDGLRLLARARRYVRALERERDAAGSF
jgi:hypothetical protein